MKDVVSDILPWLVGAEDDQECDEGCEGGDDWEDGYHLDGNFVR